MMERFGSQAAGGARASWGLRGNGSAADTITGGGASCVTIAGAATAAVCAGPAIAWTQHCVPHPAAQEHPVAWPAPECGLAEADDAHRLASGAPAATDSGNSSACNAMM